MTINTASAEWQGNLPEGKGTVELGQARFQRSIQL